jgi:pantothenate kinase
VAGDAVRGLTDELLTWVDAATERFLLGIAGPPGAGKSTLAAALSEALAERRGDGCAVVAPLDGFHLPNRELDARGLRAVKGAVRSLLDDVWYVDAPRELLRRRLIERQRA